jgi:hypothetical protein
VDVSVGLAPSIAKVTFSTLTLSIACAVSVT